MTQKELDYYVQGVTSQNRLVMAKTITLIESTLPAHQETARAVMDALLPHTGKAVRLGITGVPGAGKSTFIESFGMMLTQKGLRVAVLAVDPSSPRTGGSILADKTRMEKLSVSESAFIRPSPSSGTLGGVARKTRETMMICEAAGYDVIMVETVGVGQSEVAVASMVDFFLVLMIAGAGDELQGIKKGVLELADAITVNKADGDNIDRAKLARQQYETAMHLLSPPSPDWSTSVTDVQFPERNRSCGDLGHGPETSENHGGKGRAGEEAARAVTPVDVGPGQGRHGRVVLQECPGRQPLASHRERSGKRQDHGHIGGGPDPLFPRELQLNHYVKEPDESGGLST